MKVIVILLLLTVSNLLFAQLTDYQEKYSKSFTYESLMKYEDGIKELETIYAKYTYDYELNARIGWLYYLKGDYEKSVEFTEKAIKLKDSSFESKNMILLPLTALKKWSEVEKYANNVIKQDALNYYANIRLAYAYYLKGDNEKSLKHYELLLNYYPSDIDLKIGIANNYIKMKQNEKAKVYIPILWKESRMNNS